MKCCTFNIRWEEVFSYLSVGGRRQQKLKDTCGIKNKRIWDVPEVDDVENGQLNVLEIVVGHGVDEHIEDDTLCTMSSFLNGFDKTDAMFLKFTEDLNNPMEGSSSVGDNSVCYLRWTDVVENTSRSSRATYRFVEHQKLNTFTGFRGNCHRHFKKYRDSEEACANPPHILEQSRTNKAASTSNLLIVATGRNHFYNDSMSRLSKESQPTPKGSQPLSEIEIVSQCRVDDWATQKALVGNPNPSPVRQPVRVMP
ncbi:gamma-aminobutyrate transaminase POP2 [Cucumis melo var. makuwa]|uniref:Gamma-aminobutyrate transaminase POP2 n=1 Tax=Cucumis melo var. makuwa TaxID=1194695 RepID=A0A5A7VE01_CUCMM|nr:gamma-aminobutyrate transaminase POP2 [Cucumis melo var. makuwa]